MNEQKPKDYQKLTFIMAAICAACCVIMCLLTIISVATIVPKVNALSADLTATLDNISGITDKINQSLESIDLAGLAENVNKLVISAESELAAASEKISNIDIKGLNAAIKNLSDVIEPLAKFFNVFK